MKRKKAAAVIGIAAAIAVCAAGLVLYKVKFEEKREDVLKEYMGYIEKGRYDKMYALLDEASRNTGNYPGCNGPGICQHTGMYEIHPM